MRRLPATSVNSLLVVLSSFSPWVVVAVAFALATLLVVQLVRGLVSPVSSAWLNRQITDSSIRATVISIVGQADAVGEAGGGPALGGIGNAFGIRAALLAGAAVLTPAIALYARAVAHHGQKPELQALPEAA